MLLQITAEDNGITENEGDINSYTQFFTLKINAVNDAPSFNLDINSPLEIDEDSGEQSVSGLVTNISKGAADEVNQELDFLVTTDDNDAFFKDSQVPN